MRTPLLIWRFLFSDLLRLGLLTVAGLVGVLSFAVTVKFLADGRVDLLGGLRLMGLAAPPMLQYALPFAAGFAATLAYHRMASDNEATAAMASGVGHLTLLAPAIALGLLTAGALFGLAHQVIPRFLRQMEETIARDLTGVFVRTIERGEAVQLGDWMIYADGVIRAGPEPGVGAIERLRLTNVLAAQLDGAGNAQGSVSAGALDVWLFEVADADEDAATVAQFVFRDYVAEGQVDSFRGERGASQRVRLPSAFVDDPKYLTWTELRELRDQPQKINKVEALRRRLAMRLDERGLVMGVRDRLVSEGRVVLERGEGERIVLYGSGLEAENGRWRVLPPDRALGLGEAPQRGSGGSGGSGGTQWMARVDHELASGSVFVHRAPEITLALERRDEAGALLTDRATLQLTGVEVSTWDEQLRAAPTLRERLLITNLSIPDGGPESSPMRLATQELQQAAAAALSAPDPLGMRPALAEAAKRLRDRVADLQREVTSKQHERAAYAVATLVTMCCGSVVALRRQYGLPLPVYLWSFFPALGAVITIGAGQSLTHRSGGAGLPLLWGGVALLLGYAAWEFARYRRY